ncbi:heme-binding protein, partial [Candidatus Woesearchaeota archaeon]|nr:heme-binding protein [Candidatus Woesearchaeota archaeon]
APVVETGNNTKRIISFVMPFEYSLETLPKPNNPEVKIVPQEARKVAVLGFSWFRNADRVAEKKQELPSIKELSKPFQKLIRTYERLEIDIGLLSITSDNYPAGFKNVDIAAPLLYYRVNQELLNNKVMAVIGTRRLEDSQDITDGKKIVERLVNANYTILSGLALGCDTLAHQTAVEFSGKTIAVLGTPLDKYYPLENKDYQDFMAREHLLISQYPIGITTYPSHFAHRDKTQVHLSEGVVVIRADDKSGAQHAIKEAAKRNKQIYALKNNYGKRYSWLHTYQDNIKVPGDKSSEKI